MKIAGYEIENLEKTIIVSSGAENGYSTKFMVTVIFNGDVVYQEVVMHDCAFGATIHQLKLYKKGYKWLSRLSLTRLNKTRKSPVFGRKLDKTLIAL